jgi:hypothetical protein
MMQERRQVPVNRHHVSGVAPLKYNTCALRLSIKSIRRKRNKIERKPAGVFDGFPLRNTPAVQIGPHVVMIDFNG